MSRTFRHIPYWARNWRSSLDRTWQGIYGEDWNSPYDPRSKFHHGYDHRGISEYYDSFAKRGFKNCYRGKSRKFFKRRVNKQRRKTPIDNGVL